MKAAMVLLLVQKSVNIWEMAQLLKQWLTFLTNVPFLFFSFSGMPLPIIPSACTSSRPELGTTPHHTEHIWLDPSSFNKFFEQWHVFLKSCITIFLNIPISALVSVRNQAAQSDFPANQSLLSLVNVYVLVTSVTPLTAFLHRTGLVRTHLDKHGYITKVK